MSEKTVKERVHQWIVDRAKNKNPLPSQNEINRQIGRKLIEAERSTKERRGR